MWIGLSDAATMSARSCNGNGNEHFVVAVGLIRSADLKEGVRHSLNLQRPSSEPINVQIGHFGDTAQRLVHRQRVILSIHFGAHRLELAEPSLEHRSTVRNLRESFFVLFSSPFFDIALPFGHRIEHRLELSRNVGHFQVEIGGEFRFHRFQSLQRLHNLGALTVEFPLRIGVDERAAAGRGHGAGGGQRD